MILTLDLGNSSLYSILYDHHGNKVFSRRHDTLKRLNRDYYKFIFETFEIDCQCHIDKVILSCVVPNLRTLFEELLDEVFDCEVIVLDVNTVDLDVKLDHPQELGADFIATAIAALKLYQEPSIIIDMGTASKISVVKHPNVFLGGIIQPGLKQQAEILSQNISHLPSIDLKLPKSVIGHSTIECIQSGIMHGAFESLKGLANRIEKEMGETCHIIYTGGYVNYYEASDIEFIPDLLNDGLYYIAKKKDQ